MAENKKFNVQLILEQDLHTSSQHVALDTRVHHSTVLAKLKKEKWHPYQIVLDQEYIVRSAT